MSSFLGRLVREGDLLDVDLNSARHFGIVMAHPNGSLYLAIPVSGGVPQNRTDTRDARSAALAARIAELEAQLQEERARSESLMQSKLAAYAQLAHVEQRAAEKSRTATQLSAALFALTSATTERTHSSTALADASRLSRLESESRALQASVEELQMKISEAQGDASDGSGAHRLAVQTHLQVSSRLAQPTPLTMQRASPKAAAARTESSWSSPAVAPVISSPRSSVSSSADSASRSSASAASQTNIGFSSALNTSVPFALPREARSHKSLHVDSPRQFAPTARTSLGQSPAHRYLLRGGGSLACGSAGVRFTAPPVVPRARSAKPRRICWSSPLSPSEPFRAESPLNSPIEMCAVESLHWSRESPEPLVVQLDGAAERDGDAEAGEEEPVERSALGATRPRGTNGFGVRLPSLQIRGTAVRNTATAESSRSRAVLRWSSPRLPAAVERAAASDSSDSSVCSSNAESNSDSDTSPATPPTSLRQSSVSFGRSSPTNVRMHFENDDDDETEDEADEGEEALIAAHPKREHKSAGDSAASDSDSDSDSESDAEDSPDGGSAAAAASALVHSAAGRALSEWYRRMRARLAAGALAAAMHAESIERGELDARHWPKLGDREATETHSEEEEYEDEEENGPEKFEGGEQEQGAAEAQTDEYDEEEVASAAEVEAAHIEEVDEQEPSYEDETFDQFDGDEGGSDARTAVGPSASASPSTSVLGLSASSSPTASGPSAPPSAPSALCRWATYHAQLQFALSSSVVGDVCLPASVVFAAQRALQRQEQEQAHTKTQLTTPTQLPSSTQGDEQEDGWMML